jgi:plasmid stabilization system protein ParE
MKIRILPSAMEDLSNGFQFYENQMPALGGYFLETLFSDIDSLKLFAGIHLKVFGYHRLLSKRFPYAIYYSIDSETVLINAVLDCRRDPEFIRKRLGT